MRPCSAWCVSSFSREVVFPPCQSVCCIRVFYIFPQSCFLNCFFSLINLGFFSLFQALLDPVSETTFFRPSSEHPPPERESEREAAMKIHLKTLCVVLSKRFPGRSFPSSLSTTLRVSSFRNGFLSCLLSSCDSFFSNRNPKRPSLTRNACVVSLLLPRVGYKTTERRKSSTST